MKINILKNDLFSKWSIAYTAFCGLVSFVLSISNAFVNIGENWKLSNSLLTFLKNFFQDFHIIGYISIGFHTFIAFIIFVFGLGIYKIFFAKLKNNNQNLLLTHSFLISTILTLIWVYTDTRFNFKDFLIFPSSTQIDMVIMFIHLVSLFILVCFYIFPIMILCLLELNQKFRIRFDFLLKSKKYQISILIFSIYFLFHIIIPILIYFGYLIANNIANNTNFY